jgi:hypothetical protein
MRHARLASGPGGGRWPRRSMPGWERCATQSDTSDRVYSGASEANIFEPPRGPAIVRHLPLNPIPLMFLAASAAEAGVHELKAAMMLAGLSDGR